MSLVTTGGGFVFGGDVNGRFRVSTRSPLSEKPRAVGVPTFAEFAAPAADDEPLDPASRCGRRGRRARARTEARRLARPVAGAELMA